MIPGFQAVQSNQLECLLQQLYQHLFQESSDPFADRMIIVPHGAMKHWLQTQFAERFGISTGLRIQTEDQSIARLASLLMPSRDRFVPTRYELALAIEANLRQIGETEQYNPVWAPLLKLLHSNGTVRSSLRRIQSLARELSGLFESYGRHAGPLVTQWKDAQLLNWQERLFVEMYQTHVQWRTWSDYLSAIDPFHASEALSISLFGFSYLSPIHHRFLQRLSEAVPVSYFVLSACQHFWSDLRSEREAARIIRKGQGRGITDVQQGSFEELLQDNNPLLANLGKSGRLMAGQLEQGEGFLCGQYVVPRAFGEISAYRDCMTEDTLLDDDGTVVTLLSSIQADLALLRNPSLELPQELDSGDASIQIHIATSSQREVEALYHKLLQLIDAHGKDQDPLYPSDILVMVPTIEHYQIAIESVFGSPDSQLSYKIHDLSLETESAFISAFLDLIQLATSRWDVTTVMQLFWTPFFAGKQHFIREDLDTIRGWIEQVRITWGKSGGHRNELLQRTYCEKDMAGDAAICSWDDGFARLSRFLISDEGMEGSVKAGFSNADLLSRWIGVMQSLWADLRPLFDDAEMSVSDWITYLECLVDAYLVPTDDTTRADRSRLFELLANLRKAERSVPQALFPFSSVQKRLSDLIASAKAAHHEGALQIVRFGSMQTFSGQPARIVCMLGLDEGAFPRANRTQPLNLLSGNVLADQLPSSVDIDRYSFLDGILSARDHLILSHRGLSPTDGKEQGPSLVLSELLAYLRRHYRIGGQSADEAVTIRHPFYAFDSAYFARTGPLISYSHTHYRAAVALQNSNKSIPEGFLPHLFSIKPLDIASTEVRIVSVRELEQAAKNPLKLYLNKTLGLYLHELEESALPNDEPFVLTALELFQIIEEALDHPIEEVLQKAHLQGRLPTGTFGELARYLISLNANERHEALAGFGTHASAMLNLEMVENCSEPRQLAEKLWQIPAPEVDLSDGHSVRIVGKLSNITAQGLVSLGSCSAKHAVRSWPQLLIAQQIAPVLEKLLGKAMSNRVLFLKDAKASNAFEPDLTSHLSAFIAYTQACLEQPSPLVDDWVKIFVEKSADNVQEKILGTADDTHSFNPEAKWLLKGGVNLFDTEVVEAWKLRAQLLYADPLASIVKPKGKGKSNEAL